MLPAQEAVGLSGVGKEGWLRLRTLRLRSESFLGSLYPNCPSPALLPWLRLLVFLQAQGCRL